jgi:hypothetical protein
MRVTGRKLKEFAKACDCHLGVFENFNDEEAVVNMGGDAVISTLATERRRGNAGGIQTVVLSGNPLRPEEKRRGRAPYFESAISTRSIANRLMPLRAP